MIPIAVVVSRFKHLCAIAALAAASCAVAAVPVITSQPQDLSVGPGDRAGFAITAPGATAYQWFHDGAVVPGATGDIFVIPSATTTDAGAYSAKATSSDGITTSDTARLEIAPYTSVFVDPTFQPPADDHTSTDVIAVTSDLRLLVGGRASGSTPAIKRLNADGSLDLSFSAAADARNAMDTTAIVPLPDGRVYVSGWNGLNGFIVRLNENGTLDSTFNAGAFGQSVPRVVMLQGDKLIVARDGGLVRLNSDGSRDGSFNYQPNLSGSTPIPVGTWPGNGGTIYVAGGGLLWRLTPDGADDPTFQPISVGEILQVSALPEGGLLYATRSLGAQPVPNPVFVAGIVTLHRALNDGARDAAFHEFSYWRAAPASSGGYARFARQPDGRIVVAGDFLNVTLAAGQTLARRTLLRLQSDGTLDAGFAPTDLPSTSAAYGDHTRIVLLPSGSEAIVGVGTVDQLRRVSLVSLGAPQAPRILKVTPVQSTVLAGDDIAIDFEAVGPGPYNASGENPTGTMTATNRVVFTDVQAPITLIVKGPGGVASASAGVIVTPSAPRVFVEPQSVVTSVGRMVRLDAVVRGSYSVEREWYKEGSDAPHSSFLTVGPITEADTGTYVFRATNAYGSVERRVTISIGAHSEITNVSARATTGPGEKSLILGFAISGDRFSKGVMINALGSLDRWGVAGSLTDPQATLYSPDGRTEFNDDTEVTALYQGTAFYSRTGASLPLTPSKDSGFRSELFPGSYTVKVNGAGDTSGIVLANVFDADDHMGRIVNCSVRAYVGTGDAIAIPGFIIQGDKPKRLLIRGVGPTLAQFGVEAPLANPTLTVVDQKTGKTIVTNDDWGSDGNTDELTAAMASVGAFALPAKSQDAAVVVTLPEGGYTVLVSGSEGGTGVALIEIYELP